MIFQSDEQNNKKDQACQQWGNNIFLLSEEQKNNLNKRLPRGFCLIRKQQYQKLDHSRKSLINNIVYQPIKIQKQSDPDDPQLLRPIDQPFNPKKLQQTKRNNRFTLLSNVEGKTRQSQKIKNIIQRFRKLIKNTQVEVFLNKVGLMYSLNQIELENKRGLLTIDLFKNKYMEVLQKAKSSTFKIEVSNQIDEMIEQFICYVEQARKAEFESSIQGIQKSIDKITRYLSETIDIKAQGNWYIRKKKKIERNENYTEKEILYIGELVKKLPAAYLIGIWQIVNQKPFIEGEKTTQCINLNELALKKLKDIQIYVKTKLYQIYKSRENKKYKIQQKRKQKQRKTKLEEQEQQTEKKQNYNIFGRPKYNNPLDLFVQDEDNQMEEEQEEDKNDEAVKKQSEIPEQLVFQVLENFQPRRANKNEKNNNDTRNESKTVVKYEQEEEKKKQQNKNSSMDGNNSSDSSMITDEDDSDF